MPQLISITSEAIQAQIRRLLPSQQGFGIDMEASSVITPVIDITAAAEGSQLPLPLQQAMGHGGQTQVSVTNTTTAYSVGAGFWRFVGHSTSRASSTATKTNQIAISDGATTTTLINETTPSGSITGEVIINPFDYVFFLRPIDSFLITAGAGQYIRGTIRQVADLYGNLTNPTGFNFE